MRDGGHRLAYLCMYGCGYLGDGWAMRRNGGKVMRCYEILMRVASDVCMKKSMVYVYVYDADFH